MIRLTERVGNGSMAAARIDIEEVTDPADVEVFQKADEQHARNSEWLESHWVELLPAASGKFVAVAGQEAYIAESVEEALRWVEQAHPHDRGSIVQFVWRHEGPRIYGTRR